MPLQSLVVTLPTAPNPIDATLYYDHDFSGGHHFLDYLHIIKNGIFFRSRAQPFDPDTFEEQYWAALDKYCRGGRG
jgi:hypothetical protein